MASPMDLDDLRKLTVVKLRARLSELGLSTSGLKADLVERLHKYYQENGDDFDQGDEMGADNREGGGMSSPPPLMSSPDMSSPRTRSRRDGAGDSHHPPPLMSMNVSVPEPAHQRHQSLPQAPAPVTRTALQLKLQQMAGQPMDKASKEHQQKPTPPQPPQTAQPTPPPASKPSMPVSKPPPPTSHQMPPQMGQPPPQRLPPPPPQMNQPPAMRPPPVRPPQQPLPPGTQPLRPPPPGLGPPPPQPGAQQQAPPPRPLGQPPPPQQMPPPPPQMSQPPVRPPPAMGQPPGQMSQPPVLGQAPGQMSQPPALGQAPGQMSQPPSLSQPPGQMSQPPALGQPPGQMSQPPALGQSPGQMSQPPALNRPPGQMSQPPPLMPPPQINQQDQDLQEKVAMQTRLLEQERQQQEQQRLLEQQQKERLAIQQQTMLLQQKQPPGPPGQQGQGPPPQPPGPGAGPGPGEESSGDLMERVRQQQIMLEQQKQKERLEQQQKALMDQQNQAIKKQEEERRRSEAELIRQQQIALMEAQRDEQQKRMRDDNRGPPPPREMSRPPSSGPMPFNPQPNMLHSGPPPGPRGAMIPPPTSSSGIPPLMPPHSGANSMPGRGMDDNKGPQEPKEMKLPTALEKVLAFKDVRAQEVGMTPEELEQLDRPNKPNEEDDEIETVEMEEEDNREDEDEEEEPVVRDTSKESKNKKRKKKKKKAKKNRQAKPATPTKAAPAITEPDVQIEYVQEQLDLDPTDPNYFTFSKIFEAFKIAEDTPKEVPKVAEAPAQKTAEPVKKSNFDLGSDDEDMDEKPEDDTPKMSKKKLKKLTRLSVAQLKQLVTRPDVVEMHDVTAQDPRLLVHLKATRNTVTVPRHWCFKRKYLQGKRGIEKPPFELPDYIQATGITEMRAALAEKEEQKNLKAKMREKVRPKLGNIDIDYQKWHDAFFRFQTKPKMTIHGDLYYEGKEFETRLKEKKPGNLSDDLKTALGMPIGPTSEKVPPPWLIAMQRYGPPPSYPNLKIAGLNAPIPEHCSFGYHAGGWGKPPVDENGKPLYGDVFGTKSSEFETQMQEEDVDKTKWGELESESESEEESSEEEEEEMPDDTGLITPAEGLVTPSGITSVPVGMETPDMIELRKRRIEDAMDQGGETPALYQVLPEKKTAVGGAMMGSAHIYDVGGAAAAGAKKPGDKPTAEGIEVALNPEELDLDTAAMQAKYDQTLREQQSQLEKEDLSDMVAEHAAKQKKRKKKQEDSGKAAKKYKEFKF